AREYPSPRSLPRRRRNSQSPIRFRKWRYEQSFLPSRAGEATSSKLNRKTNEKLAVGKGATVQEFVANRGSQPLKSDSKRKPCMIPVVKAKLLEGKKGLIVGIANENSIAWGCAKAFRAFGAELAVTYLNDKAKKYVEPLARELEAPIMLPLDVRTPGQMEA